MNRALQLYWSKSNGIEHRQPVDIFLRLTLRKERETNEHSTITNTEIGISACCREQHVPSPMCQRWQRYHFFLLLNKSKGAH
jgi:hypothetical protein